MSALSEESTLRDLVALLDDEPAEVVLQVQLAHGVWTACLRTEYDQRYADGATLPAAINAARLARRSHR